MTLRDSGPGAPAGAAVIVEGLSKRFRVQTEKRTAIRERIARGKAPKAKEFWALKNASFSVPKGSVFGIVGHNGSGKSTALKVLAGIYRPTEGHVQVNGRVSALLELGAGFHPELSGRENIHLNGAILGMPRSQINDSIEDIIDFAGIRDFIDAPVKTYSSGMAVRLGFSVAVKMDPEILIVDEVIAVGDEEFQRQCFDYLFELRQRGTTIILVTHSLGSVENLCDQALWLDHGEVRTIGPAREVVKQYVDQVNEAEAQRRPASATHAELFPARIGSGEVQVQNVEYFDQSGHPVNFAISGEPLTIRIQFQATQDLSEVDFGIAFVHESGVTVSGPSTRPVGPWRVAQGEGHLEFLVPDLLLQPGAYWLSIGVVSGLHCYDFLPRAFELKIRTGALMESGLTRLPGQWELRSNSTTASPKATVR